MTREQAEEILREKTSDKCTLSDMKNFLDMSTALGMLKLDEPIGPNEKFILAIHEIPLNFRLPGNIWKAISDAGLKIVEK